MLTSSKKGVQSGGQMERCERTVAKMGKGRMRDESRYPSAVASYRTAHSCVDLEYLPATRKVTLV